MKIAILTLVVFWLIACGQNNAPAKSPEWSEPNPTNCTVFSSHPIGYELQKDGSYQQVCVIPREAL